MQLLNQILFSFFLTDKEKSLLAVQQESRPGPSALQVLLRLLPQASSRGGAQLHFRLFRAELGENCQAEPVDSPRKNAKTRLID